MRSLKGKKKKGGKSLTSMAREELVSHLNHGGGKSDPTKGKAAAGPGKKLLQVG